MLAFVFLLMFVVIWVCWGWIGRIVFSATTVIAWILWAFLKWAAGTDAQLDASEVASFDVFGWFYLVPLGIISALRYRYRRRAAEEYYAAEYRAGYSDGYSDGGAR